VRLSPPTTRSKTTFSDINEIKERYDNGMVSAEAEFSRRRAEEEERLRRAEEERLRRVEEEERLRRAEEEEKIWDAEEKEMMTNEKPLHLKNRMLNKTQVSQKEFEDRNRLTHGSDEINFDMGNIVASLGEISKGGYKKTRRRKSTKRKVNRRKKSTKNRRKTHRRRR